MDSHNEAAARPVLKQMIFQSLFLALLTGTDTLTDLEDLHPLGRYCTEQPFRPGQSPDLAWSAWTRATR